MNETLENEQISNDQTEPATESSREDAAAVPPADGDAAELPLEDQLARERERSQAYLEDLKRERAAFINFRRRSDQERQSWAREANSSLIFNLLPVIDDFERAASAIPVDQQGTPWVEGLMLVGRKLESTLELAGLKAIDALGKPFDPNLHEAVAVGEAEGAEHNTVLEEYRKGYMLGDRVLRPSMVKVAQ